MDYLKTYNLQIEFYKDVKLAWKSLSDDAKLYIKSNHPELLPDCSKKKRKYFLKCWRITERNKDLIQGIEKRKFRQFDIDHIVPVAYGYKHNISPVLIGSVDNLRILSHRENHIKSVKLTDEGRQLLSMWGVMT